ncbi:MAG: tail fiber domain-containing protein, partial [Elusimicrobia bacterium]|nr:tail fiber domain-containing protein [Elusimicrobiota bacterium]
YSMIVSTTSNPDFYQFLVSKDGNVGIGITNPSVPLDVYRQISLSTSKIEDIILNFKTAGATSYMRFDDSDMQKRGAMGLIGAGTRDFVYKSAATSLSDGAEVYRIKLNGNMGIGTANPSERLHVATNFLISTGTIPILYVSTITGNISISTTSASTKLFVNGGIFAVSSITANQGYYGDIAGNLNFNGSKIYLSGNTGIGTTNPGARLDIKESGTETYTLAVGTSIYTYDFVVTTKGFTGIGLSAPTDQLHVMGSVRIGAESYGDTFAYLHLRPVGGDTYIRWGTGQEGNKGLLGFPGGVKDFVYRANASSFSDGAEVFRIKENSLNFGIGTPSPIERFHVATSLLISSDSANPILFVSTGTGNIGAGTLSPSARLHVTGSSVLDPLILSTGAQAGAEVLVVKKDGNVGIGLTNPTYKLDVNGNTRASGFLKVGNTASESIQFEPQGAYHRISYTQLRFYDYSTSNEMVTFNDGNVGIGTTNPLRPLHVNGSAANTTGVWDVLSDVRLKTGIAPLTSSLEKVRKLKGVSFYWKDPERIGADSGKHIGLIAQEVEKIMPQWVKEDKNGYKWLSKEGIDAVLVEAIKEQQSMIEENDKRIEVLKRKLKELEAKEAIQ